jgi:hypothetical protein
MISNLYTINGWRLAPIDHASGRFRASVQEYKMFHPAMRFKVFTKEGKKVYPHFSPTNAISNFKIANFHKHGMVVFAITKWREMFNQLELLRNMTIDNRWVAVIKEPEYHGVNGVTINQCIDELATYNIDAYSIEHWSDSVKILNDYAPRPIVIGTQSNGYIIDICNGDRSTGWQTYNKIPGYVYPARYMQPH